MKLIHSPKQLTKEFERLFEKYKELHWATAWASTSSELFPILKNHENKIKRIIVGLHFYQTHPEFIASFLPNSRVRYIIQPSGTFHPKLYLFYTSDQEWELIVGSPNFTNDAFARNSEISVLLNYRDIDANKVLNKILGKLDQYWAKANSFNTNELENYRKIWANHRNKIKSLSGSYSGGSSNPKPLFTLPLAVKDWVNFLSDIKKDPDLDRRLILLQNVRSLFRSTKHFYDLTLNERQYVAGLPKGNFNLDNKNWELFGTVSGMGTYHHLINSNHRAISEALDQVPLDGQVVFSDYERFCMHFQNAFKNTKDEHHINLAAATRLLTMKRPDTFISINHESKDGVSRDFGIPKSKLNYQTYWEDIILRIYDCEWWLNPKPKNDQEIQIMEARAAFLDSLYYHP